MPHRVINSCLGMLKHSYVDAVLVPSPPKAASQTLAEVISTIATIPTVRARAHNGVGNLVINIPNATMHERARRMFMLTPKREGAVVYGHYPASAYNLNEIRKRYRIRLCCMPVRPIGSTLCSLINHTSHRKGPLDPRILNLTESHLRFHQLTNSELFELFAIRYLGAIQSIIDGWIQTCISESIPIIVFPFESTIGNQQAIMSILSSEWPRKQQTSKNHGDSPCLNNEIKRNISTGEKALLCSIDKATLDRVAHMAAVAFDYNNARDQITPVHDYLLSDLNITSEAIKVGGIPIAWRFGH